MLTRAVYSLLISIAAAIALFVLFWRALWNPAYRDRIGERLGLTTLRYPQGCLWVHAASMGEVQAAAALVRALLEQYPEVPVLMTTATPTGAARVTSLFGCQIAHAYLPYDVPWAVRSFLDRVRPRIAVILETEIWPSLYGACEVRRVPVLLASARLSAKSVKRYQMVRRVLPGLLSRVLSVPEIAAQTRADAERFVSIGAPSSRVTVAGNLKFDMDIDPQLAAAAAQLRASLGKRPVWVAGSTHAVEEAQVLEAHAQIRARLPETLLVLVPRHPQRFEEVASDLRGRQIAFGRRSSGVTPQVSDSVYLIDAMGELLRCYAAADVSYVGGTLIPLGGHNLLEPAAVAKPVICGPHTFNSGELAGQLADAGALIQIHSAHSLSEQVTGLLLDEHTRTKMGAAGAAFVAANRGTRERLLARVAAMLEGS